MLPLYCVVVLPLVSISRLCSETLNLRMLNNDALTGKTGTFTRSIPAPLNPTTGES